MSYLPRGPTPGKPAAVPKDQPPIAGTAQPAPTGAPAESAARVTSPRSRRLRRLAVDAGWLAIAAVAVLFPMLRAFGILQWSWGLTLAPFTTFGVMSIIAMGVVLFRPKWDAYRASRSGARGSAVAATPAPDELARPLNAEEAGERILAEHPELLAAICHGFRRFRLVPSLFDRPITDPWAVYQAALVASPVELQLMRLVARQHVERFAATAPGRRPPEAHVMKRAMDAFRKCAEKTLSGRAEPDCAFEHIVVVFGTQSSPNRDALLASVVPKVRVLLERQYPQLTTARLDDGTSVKYAEWSKQAALDKAEIARLERDHERLVRELDEKSSELGAAVARIESLQNAAGEVKREARVAARSEQAQLTDELRATIDRAHLEHARQLQRTEGERDRLQESVTELTQERDMFQRLLFTHSDDEEIEPAAADGLAGRRVVLIGGDAAQVPQIRAHLEGYGIQLVQADGPGAEDLVAGADLVVLWIRYVSHPTAFTIKRECRSRRVPIAYWARTSPTSLVGLIVQTEQASL